MLVELSVMEQRYHAGMEALSGGVPIVRGRRALRGGPQDGAQVDRPLPRRWAGGAGGSVASAAFPASAALTSRRWCVSCVGRIPAGGLDGWCMSCAGPGSVRCRRGRRCIQVLVRGLRL